MLSEFYLTNVVKMLTDYAMMQVRNPAAGRLSKGERRGRKKEKGIS